MVHSIPSAGCLEYANNPKHVYYQYVGGTLGGFRSYLACHPTAKSGLYIVIRVLWLNLYGAVHHNNARW